MYNLVRQLPPFNEPEISFDIILDLMPLMVAVLDPSGTIVWENALWNEAYQAYGHLLPMGSLGENFFNIISHYAKEHLENSFLEALGQIQTGQKLSFSSTMCFPLFGQNFYLKLDLQALCQGKQPGFLVKFTDTTEFHKLSSYLGTVLKHSQVNASAEAPIYPEHNDPLKNVTSLFREAKAFRYKRKTTYHRKAASYGKSTLEESKTQELYLESDWAELLQPYLRKSTNARKDVNDTEKTTTQPLNAQESNRDSVSAINNNGSGNSPKDQTVVININYAPDGSVQSCHEAEDVSVIESNSPGMPLTGEGKLEPAKRVALRHAYKAEARTSASRNEMKIEASELKVGMRVSRDIYSAQGVKLLPAGSSITQALWQGLQRYLSSDSSIKIVYIYR